LKERYFNQALLLVGNAEKRNQIKVDKYSLKRIKYTTPQVFLKGKERVKNVKGAFLADNAYNITDKKILLVDDIYTTGATVNECSYVLKRAGALKVDVLTLAKTVIF
jgi:ComF family protein